MTKEAGLSKRAYAAVQKEFAAEAATAFGFLATEFGLAGPEHQGAVLPVVAFAGRRALVNGMFGSGRGARLSRVGRL